jgi:hypothetical protein
MTVTSRGKPATWPSSFSCSCMPPTHPVSVPCVPPAAWRSGVVRPWILVRGQAQRAWTALAQGGVLMYVEPPARGGSGGPAQPRGSRCAGGGHDGRAGRQGPRVDPAVEIPASPPSAFGPATVAGALLRRPATQLTSRTASPVLEAEARAVGLVPRARR